MSDVRFYDMLLVFTLWCGSERYDAGIEFMTLACYAMSGTGTEHGVGSGLRGPALTRESASCQASLLLVPLRRSPPLYAGRPAIYGGRAAIYGHSSAIHGHITAIYGDIAAVYGDSAAVYGDNNAIDGSDARSGPRWRRACG
eukprot:1299111-Rhodomonas_salina.1